MTFGSTFGRTFSPTFQPKSQAAAAASSWWLAGGIDPANCSAIDQLKRVKDDFDNIKLTLDQIALGGDYTALAGYLGVTAAQAEAVYNLWGSANAELQGATFIAQLLSRCG